MHLRPGQDLAAADGEGFVVGLLVVDRIDEGAGDIPDVDRLNLGWLAEAEQSAAEIGHEEKRRLLPAGPGGEHFVNSPWGPWISEG